MDVLADASMKNNSLSPIAIYGLKVYTTKSVVPIVYKNLTEKALNTHISQICVYTGNATKLEIFVNGRIVRTIAFS